MKKRGLHKVSTYKQYFQDVYKHSKKLNLLLNLKKNKKKLLDLVLPIKGNVLLQFCNIGNKDRSHL